MEAGCIFLEVEEKSLARMCFVCIRRREKEKKKNPETYEKIYIKKVGCIFLEA